MQVNSFKAILAALSVATFASACTPGHDSKSLGTSAAAAAKATNPAEFALATEMSKYQSDFDVTQTFLTSKLGAVQISSIGVADAGTDDLNATMQLKGSLVLRASSTVYTFQSQPILVSELRSGKIFDVTMDDNAKTDGTLGDIGTKLQAELGGLLSLKARCMDAGCQSVSMWLQSYQLGRINTAGLIFSADAKSNSYFVSNSQHNLVSSTVAKYADNMTRSSREDDGISVANHDIAPSASASAAKKAALQKAADEQAKKDAIEQAISSMPVM